MGGLSCVTGLSFSSTSSQTARGCRSPTYNSIIYIHTYIYIYIYIYIYKLSRYYMFPLQRTGTDLVYIYIYRITDCLKTTGPRHAVGIKTRQNRARSRPSQISVHLASPACPRRQLSHRRRRRPTLRCPGRFGPFARSSPATSTSHQPGTRTPCSSFLLCKTVSPNPNLAIRIFVFGSDPVTNVGIYYA
jgi:hypothetical protein